MAGLLAFVFARIFAEPQIAQADRLRERPGRRPGGPGQGRRACRRAPPGPDIFSRTIQANVGIGVGMVFFGIAMGALFAVAYTVCLGRVGRLRARTLALLVAAGRVPRRSTSCRS